MLPNQSKNPLVTLLMLLIVITIIVIFFPIVIIASIIFWIYLKLTGKTFKGILQAKVMNKLKANGQFTQKPANQKSEAKNVNEEPVHKDNGNGRIIDQ